MHKGEIIQCSNCKLDLYETLKDQYQGDPIMPEDFRGIGAVPNPARGQLIICMECSTPWLQLGRAYIKNVGWSGGLVRKGK